MVWDGVLVFSDNITQPQQHDQIIEKDGMYIFLDPFAFLNIPLIVIDLFSLMILFIIGFGVFLGCLTLTFKEESKPEPMIESIKPIELEIEDFHIGIMKLIKTMFKK